MKRGDPRDWMWSEALQMLAQAERLHGQVFRPQTAGRLRANWEPPVDVLETEREVLILAALPGVDVQTVEARFFYQPGSGVEVAVGPACWLLLCSSR